jgi:hypothetical protein
MTDEFLPNQDILPIRLGVEGGFKFASRGYGRLLLSMLALSWIAGFFWLFYALITQLDLSNEALDAGEVSFTILMMLLLLVLFTLLNTAAFLPWIYKVHQDLEDLHPHYPISPRRALAEVSIPFYNLYGLNKVFTELSEQFEPHLQIWPGLIVLAYFLSGIGNLFRQFGALAWLEQLGPLVAVSIWFIVTIRVHRALGASVERQVEETPSPGHKKRWFLLGLALTIITVCSMAILFLIPKVLSSLSWFDDDYWHLFNAMIEYTSLDDRIISISPQIGWVSEPGGETGVWLIIILETTLTCLNNDDDPCARLAEEYGRVALSEYERINELSKMQITVTTVGEDGPVPGVPVFDRSASISEWRQALKKSVVPYGG